MAKKNKGDRILKPKYDFQAQEAVVSALYDVIRLNNIQPHNCVSSPGTNMEVSVSLSAIGHSLTEIMDAFGYDVQHVD